MTPTIVLRQYNTTLTVSRTKGSHPVVVTIAGKDTSLRVELSLAEADQLAMSLRGALAEVAK